MNERSCRFCELADEKRVLQPSGKIRCTRKHAYVKPGDRCFAFRLCRERMEPDAGKAQKLSD